MGRNAPREYEFFPEKGGKITSFKDLEFPLEEASVAVHGDEASCLTPTGYYSDNNACPPSNSIDLSLKLSV